MTKVINWLGTSKEDIKAFPAIPRQIMGYQLGKVQAGGDADDSKPFSTIGPGAYEIRVRAGGQWRLMYVAKFAEAVYVLHVFQKKTMRTSPVDVELAKTRYREMIQERQHG
jgi:phage-related protein